MVSTVNIFKQTHLLKTVKILCTSVGNDGFYGVYEALKKRDDIHITGADADQSAYGLLLADAALVIPKRKYTEKLLIQIVEFYRENQIDMLLPLSTEDQSFYSFYYKRLSESGLNIAVSPYQSVEALSNKHNLYRLCRDNGFPIPKFEISNSAEKLISIVENYANSLKKCVLKKATGTGAQGVKIIDPQKTVCNRFFLRDNISISPEEAINFLENAIELPELMITDYLDGTHISIDGFRSESGFFTAGIRTETKHLYGAGIAGESILNDALFQIAKNLTEKLNYRYAFNLEMKSDANGNFKIIEFNPRFAAGIDHTVKAGINIPLLVVDEALKIDNKVEIKFMPGIQYRKYWNSICYSNDKISDK